MLKPLPSRLPCTDSVWVRVCQAASFGSFSLIWSMLRALPRSICAHCGKLLLALSQYVAWLPSLMLPMPLAPLVLLDVAGRPLERFGPPAACAGTACAVIATRAATASADSTLRVTCLFLIGFLCLVLRAGCGGWQVAALAVAACGNGDRLAVRSASRQVLLWSSCGR
ncbi:hypothetical protein GCM10007977_008200 [Dactylosporangium sucinum]|uniref:Uncharacterized protein n=1 Tax=Dactylosporangium sucinum TaxID=1424081 RepID=A0A917T549_9ACTN|nr:hypothetical protein GCM10007977_008200 [Dactylosporangium sucinum]